MYKLNSAVQCGWKIANLKLKNQRKKRQSANVNVCLKTSAIVGSAYVGSASFGFFRKARIRNCLIRICRIRNISGSQILESICQICVHMSGLLRFANLFTPVLYHSQFYINIETFIFIITHKFLILYFFLFYFNIHIWILIFKFVFYYFHLYFDIYKC